MPLASGFATGLHHCRHAALAACGLLLAAPAAALELCVGTPQELTAALSALDFPVSGNEVVVRLRTGTYTLSTAALSSLWSPANNVQLLGGYGGTDCAQRGVDPRATRLLVPAGEELAILLDGHNLLMERLRVESQKGVRLIGSSEGPDLQMVLRQIHIVTNQDGLRIKPRYHQVRIENSLILGVGLEYWTSSGDQAVSFTLVNSTVVHNNGAAVRLDRSPGTPAAQVNLYNNILRGTAAGGGLAYSNPDRPLPNVIHAFHNLWTAVSVPIQVQTGNSTADPQLGPDYLPEPGSPAVNAGFNGVPGGLGELDGVGVTRQIGSRVDIGGRETAVDDGQTLLVSNADDSGPGSFRQALINANANPDFNHITFDVPMPSGQCLLLQPATVYPAIVHPLRIDGGSQPGSAPNTAVFGDNARICVRIVKLGTRLPWGLRVTGGRLTLSGVGLGGFDRALDLAGGGDHHITGNHVGTGLVDFFPANGIGIEIATHPVNVGGYGVGQRNVIAGSSSAGILLRSARATINGNYIGTSRDGQERRPNAKGIRVEHVNRANIVINNVISGNDVGVDIDNITYGTEDPNRYGGNRIGLRALRPCIPLPGAPSCADDLGNRIGIAVDLQGQADGAGLGENIGQNRIAYNTDQGVRVVRSDGVRLYQNAIYANGGIGIDLVSASQPEGPNPVLYDGPTAPAVLVNRGQNTPEPASAVGDDDEGVVHARLQSHNGSFRIEAFSNLACDDSGTGEGQTYLGAMQITIDDASPTGPGLRVFTMPIARGGGGPLIGKAITLTATSALGDTSEFSACVAYADGGSDDHLFSDDFEEIIR